MLDGPAFFKGLPPHHGSMGCYPSGGRHEQKGLSAQRRRQIVEAVRRGLSQREATRRFGVSQPTVHYWAEQAGARRLARARWEDQPPIPRATRRTPASIEDLILDLR